ncbi:CG11095 [Drosophila busckii]|uniref:CG11095 n=1 Tax=Drosophila busckii TaxID=30019 RepID=A0A0M4EJE8_DROBS|nr:nucleoside diphosphate-linked moiety X motif 8 [Drosophila busckii]ALC49254.1 CG11095 [Drosophila busckii]
MCSISINARLLRPLMQAAYTQAKNKSRNVASAVPVLSTADQQFLLEPEQRQRCLEQLNKLPVVERPKSMAPAAVRHENSAASVLIALCLERETNEVSLLYTRRSRHLRRHSLQVSFPGGKRDDTDASFVDCALRETEEEIGLGRERVDVWGESNAIKLPRTGPIVPVIGVVKDFHVSELKLNWDEVEEAFSIPLNTLLTAAAARHTQFRSGYSSPAFVATPVRIWGITGYLTYVFLRCLLPRQMLPESLKTNLKFVRPYKLPPKTHHHAETGDLHVM